MADLNSTLTITGVVNGRKISYTHTYTLEDVYDAGVYLSEASPRAALLSTNTSGGEEITFSQDTPNYVLGTNPDTAGVVNVECTLASGSIGFMLPPGGLFCLTGNAGTAINTNSATSITMANMTRVSAQFVAPFINGRVSLLVAFNAVT